MVELHAKIIVIIVRITVPHFSVKEFRVLREKKHLPHLLLPIFQAQTDILLIRNTKSWAITLIGFFTH